MNERRTHSTLERWRSAAVDEWNRHPQLRDMPPWLAVGFGVVVVCWVVFASGPWALLAAGLGLIFLVPAVWVYFDSTQNGMQRSLAWAGFSMLTSPIGLLVYLLVRPKAPVTAKCGQCARTLLQIFHACPYCGAERGRSPRCCRSCSREVELQWRFCPYCRKPLDEESLAAGDGPPKTEPAPPNPRSDSQQAS